MPSDDFLMSSKKQSIAMGNDPQDDDFDEWDDDMENSRKVW